MKNKSKKQTRTGLGCKVIDIESTYKKMKETLQKRYDLQRRYHELWSVIKRNHCNRNSEMERLSDGIGETTHRLNGLISELCHYKKTHKAMNLAYQFINQEIDRATKIIGSNEGKIRDTEAGRCSLITAEGIVTTDTRSLRQYVNGKRAQVQKLQAWKNHVKKYMA